MNQDTWEKAFNDLSFYTWSHPDPSFIHQHVVDAFGVQAAGETTKQIRIIFALAGLYLYLEKGYTGKEVQQFHMLMAKRKMDWPEISLPEYRGDITVTDVLDTEPGAARDQMIHRWCHSVWDACRECREKIIHLVNNY